MWSAGSASGAAWRQRCCLALEWPQHVGARCRPQAGCGCSSPAAAWIASRQRADAAARRSFKNRSLSRFPSHSSGTDACPLGALLPQSYGARLARDSSKDAARSSCKTSCANLQPSLLLSRDVQESIVLSMSTKAHLSEKQMR